MWSLAQLLEEIEFVKTLSHDLLISNFIQYTKPMYTAIPYNEKELLQFILLIEIIILLINVNEDLILPRLPQHIIWPSANSLQIWILIKEFNLHNILLWIARGDSCLNDITKIKPNNGLQLNFPTNAQDQSIRPF